MITRISRTHAKPAIQKQKVQAQPNFGIKMKYAGIMYPEPQMKELLALVEDVNTYGKRIDFFSNLTVKMHSKGESKASIRVSGKANYPSLKDVKFDDETINASLKPEHFVGNVRESLQAIYAKLSLAELEESLQRLKS